MKRYFILILTALIVTGSAFAQAPSGQTPETITLRGNLSVQNGQIALKNGETLYYIHGLNRLIGFVEGLKEGATVVLEGYSFDLPPAGTRRSRNDAENPRESAAAPAGKLFVTQKLTLNGREYDNLGTRFAQGAPLMPDRGTMPGPRQGEDRRSRQSEDRRPRQSRNHCW
jgi:hypothetical protein